MARYVFDCETDGLLDTLTLIHCLVLKNVDGGQVLSFAPGAVEDGLRLLADAEEIIGHNIIRFDIPAIQKVYPWFKPKGKITDTVVISRLIWSDLKVADRIHSARYKFFPAKMIGKHSLESWGYRFNMLKGDYASTRKESYISLHGPRPKTDAHAWDTGLVCHTWGTWSQSMQSYCEQDVEVTFRFHQLILKKNYSQEAIDLEMDFQTHIAAQERNGIPFDIPAAQALYATLVDRRTVLEDECRALFADWYVKDGETTPKKTVTYKDKGRADLTQGAPYTKIKLTSFNPGSRAHIADRLITIRGWQPLLFTDDGAPTVDDEVLAELPWPEAQAISEYLMVQKRTGMLADGSGGWLKKVVNGRIHGGVNTNGAVTGRCTHMSPNLAQVPTNDVPYGRECRALFYAPPGYSLVGADASGLELRCLAHFMARYDGGNYIKVLLEGDVHWVNAIALGIIPEGTVFDPHNDTHLWARNKVAKRWIYAFLYGAGDTKLGIIAGAGKEIGKKMKGSFLKRTPAIAKLKDNIIAVAYPEVEPPKLPPPPTLRGLDGRTLVIRSKHASLNTLLQSAGALLMKKALNIAVPLLAERGMVEGRDYFLVLNVHDEIQALVEIGKEELFGTSVVEAIKLAGEAFKFRCPLDGTWHAGRNWAETH